MSALEVLDLAKTLGDRREAGAHASAILRGVNLKVPAGRCAGIRGATGSGKSTLLRIVAGLETPDRGEVRLDGIAVSTPSFQLPPGKRRIGFVFQHLGLWPHLDAEGHLDYVLEASSLDRDARARRKAQVIDAFHLRGLMRRKPVELSGGERHLLAIARALAGEVRLVLMDEPFAGLDGRLKQVVLDALKTMLRERQLTALLVSHHPDDFAALCEVTWHMREGHLSASDAASPRAYGSSTGKGDDRGVSA